MTRTSRNQLLGSEAKAKLEEAAKAVGLSPHDLADLVFESGLAPQGSDGITETFTLEELGKRMLGEMQLAESKPNWFASLVPTQQRALICVLRSKGFTTETIARDLDVNPREVLRTWNAYHDELGAQVVGVRLETIAGQLQYAAEKATEMAMAKNDPRTVWAVAKELTGVLQDIGIVDRAIKRVEVTHKMDDEQKAELERLAELRNKQKVRLEEIKSIESATEQTDPLPPEVEEELD